MRKTIIAIFAMLVGTLVHADELIIGAWNIADLHHEDGVEARPGIGTRRDAEDFDTIRKYANQFGRDGEPADVIALQEIGTEEGAYRIFPRDNYQILMSSRYFNDGGTGGDIYTAIAIRTDSAVNIVRQEDLMGLAISDTAG